MRETHTGEQETDARSGLGAPGTDDLVEEVLVEEMSIDGMCGVY